MTDKIASDITVASDGFSHLNDVLALNRRIFGEDRLLNRLDHHPLIFLTAHCEGRLAGFKIGYPLNCYMFYSAKGATSPLYRRRGVANHLLLAMIAEVSALGFRELHFDTFPARYPGMTIIGLKNGFHIKKLIWNKDYGDFQVRMWRPVI